MMDDESHTDPSRTVSGEGSVEVPAEDPIDLDLVCRRCGYNLRGLDRAGHCPECRAEVGRSETGGPGQY